MYITKENFLPLFAVTVWNILILHRLFFSHNKNTEKIAMSKKVQYWKVCCYSFSTIYFYFDCEFFSVSFFMIWKWYTWLILNDEFEIFTKPLILNFNFFWSKNLNFTKPLQIFLDLSSNFTKPLKSNLKLKHQQTANALYSTSH